MLSAVTAVLVKYLLFRHLSIDNDEALYSLQAKTIASGHLFPRAPLPTGSYAPWLAAVADGHYVLKYTPVIPTFFAASIAVTGGTYLALAIVVAAAVVVTYLLGVEVLDDRRAAAVAATLLAVSPLVVIQSALILPYLPVLVLLELAVLGLLRGLRTGRSRSLVGVGLAVGFAAAVRPYDVVLFLLPMIAWLVRTQPGRRMWAVRGVVLGCVVPAGMLLATNAAATGNAFRLPFALLEPQDKLGFGVRRLYPADRAHHFGIVEGLAGVGNHLFLLAGWASGGLVLAVLAVAVVARRRVGGPGIALAAGGLVMIVGYIGFWGAWNAADLWGGIRYVGPFYLMPLMIPLVLLGARGVLDLAARRRRIAAGAAVVGIAASVVALVVALPANATFNRRDTRLAAAVHALPGRPLVLVDTDPRYLMHPSSLVANPPELDGKTLYAVRQGAADLQVVADHPDRPAYGLRISYTWNHTPGAVSIARFERLGSVTATSATLPVTVRPEAGWSSARLVEFDRGMRRSYPLDPRRAASLSLTLDEAGARITGDVRAPTVTALKPTTDRSVTIFLLATPPGGHEQLVDRARVSVREGDGQLRVIGATAQTGAVGADGPPPLTVTLPPT